jgi:thiol-disulfide isomerase/thioredoxin
MIASMPRLSLFRFVVWLSCLACGTSLGAAGADIRPFTAKSVQEIRQTLVGKPFVLAFWSLHCAPCKEEMTQLKELHRKHPTLPIVLVSTDGPREREAVVKFLAKHELGGIETRAYADDFDERVRFAVDRTWRGELPRTYFFDAAHRSTAHTGLLDPKWIDTWLAGARQK